MVLCQEVLGIAHRLAIKAHDCGSRRDISRGRRKTMQICTIPHSKLSIQCWKMWYRGVLLIYLLTLLLFPSGRTMTIWQMTTFLDAVEFHGRAVVTQLADPNDSTTYDVTAAHEARLIKRVLLKLKGVWCLTTLVWAANSVSSSFFPLSLQLGSS